MAALTEEGGGDDMDITNTWALGVARMAEAAEFFVCSGGGDDDMIVPEGCGTSLDTVLEDVRARVVGAAPETYREAAAPTAYAPPRGADLLLATSMPAYVVDCSAPSRERKRCCVLAGDLGGLHDPVEGPRLRALADRAARDLGCLCVVPDVFRRSAWNAAQQGDRYGDADRRRAWLADHGDPARLGAALDDVVVPFLADRGGDTSRVAVLGLGFGGVCALVAARYDWCAAGAAADADFDALAVFGDDAAAAAARAARCPQMLLNAAAPADAAVRNALVATPIGGACVFDAYPAMRPGFVLRGDAALPAVDRDVELATARLLAFLRPHLPE